MRKPLRPLAEWISALVRRGSPGDSLNPRASEVLERVRAAVRTIRAFITCGFIRLIRAWWELPLCLFQKCWRRGRKVLSGQLATCRCAHGFFCMLRMSCCRKFFGTRRGNEVMWRIAGNLPNTACRETPFISFFPCALLQYWLCSIWYW